MWFKIDDKAHSHPKVIEAGNAAIGLWTRCGSWSGERLTEGYIPRKTARMFGTLGEIRRLVEVGLFVEVDGGFQMHDFLKYNLTAEQVKDVQGKRSEAGKKGAKARWEPKANALATSMANAMANRCPEPEPEPEVLKSLTDRPTCTVPDGLSSVIHDAIEIRVRHAAHHAGTSIANRHAWTEGVRRNVTAEHAPALQAHLEHHPQATAEELASAVFGLTELDLYRATRTA